MKITILASISSIWLLSGYPIQLALGKNKWLNGVVEKYPLQKVAFVAMYIVPQLILSLCVCLVLPYMRED